jgi:hypothetical protein
MNRTAADSIVSSPRRFILLPEAAAEGSARPGRIRRYQLTSIGHGRGRDRLRLGGAGTGWPVDELLARPVLR